MGSTATDTQLEALDAIREAKITQRARVARFIRAGAASDEEISRGLDMRLNSVHPRRKELENLGKVRDSGKRRTNSTSGLRVIVWEWIPKGEQTGPKKIINWKKEAAKWKRRCLKWKRKYLRSAR